MVPRPGGRTPEDGRALQGVAGHALKAKRRAGRPARRVAEQRRRGGDNRTHHHRAVCERARGKGSSKIKYETFITIISNRLRRIF